MQKLIILTACIIRGEYHINSLGLFYKKYNKYLKNFEVYHIFNIDQPKYLKRYFSVYETLELLDNIIPSNVNKTIILNKNPGFLTAFKNLTNKVIELNLLSDDNIYWWFEDDWKCNCSYNIFELTKNICNIQNSAITFTNSAPLGSFRGGPLMSYSYFMNFFNIEKIGVMNSTCDPEKQVNRWLCGINRENGNQKIHRDITKNNTIHIILIYNNKNDIDFIHFTHSYYKNNKKFNEDLIFKYYILINNNNNNNYNYKFTQIDYEKDYEKYKDNIKDILFKNITLDELKIFFNEHDIKDNIKYFIHYPTCFTDTGRSFNEQYSLQKWTHIEDNTSYTNTNIIDAVYGIWKNISEDEIRLSPKLTSNKGFFSSFVHILHVLPYLNNKYFLNNVHLNLIYYSHTYGNYPNFNVFGKVIKLNYTPHTQNNIILQEKDKFYLNELNALYIDQCGYQYDIHYDTIDTHTLYSFKNNFKLAHDYLFKFFKFDDDLINKKEEFVKCFKNKKVLGLHFRATDMLSVKWIQYISIENFISIIEYHLTKNYYDSIYIASDDVNVKIKLKNIFKYKYEILCYDDQQISNDNKSIHSNQYTKICDKIKNIKKILKTTNNTGQLQKCEIELKKECSNNQLLLENVILESMILSCCTCVIKTHSQVSAFSKIFNPNLEIYRINGSSTGFFPDAYIPVYDIKNIDDENIKNILINSLKTELGNDKKFNYLDMQVL